MYSYDGYKGAEVEMDINVPAEDVPVEDMAVEDHPVADLMSL